MFVGTLRTNRAMQAVFLLLAILFFMLAIADYTANADLKEIAGYVGIATGMAAIVPGHGPGPAGDPRTRGPTGLPRGKGQGQERCRELHEVNERGRATRDLMCPPGQSFTMSVQPFLSSEELIVSRIVLEGETVAGVVEAKATITFTEENNVQGYGGCNRFFGGYRLEGDRISFSAIASTRRYCEETMAVEDAFFRALGKVTRLKVSVDGLTLLSEDGSTEVMALAERVESDG